MKKIFVFENAILFRGHLYSSIIPPYQKLILVMEKNIIHFQFFFVLVAFKKLYTSINNFFSFIAKSKAEPSPYFWLAMKYTTNYIYNTMMSLWFIFHNKQVVKKFVPYPNHEMVRVQSSKTLKKESPPNSSCLFRNSHMYYVYRGWVKMAVSK